MNKEKIIEIAKFRGIEDLACKSCGVVSALESVTYEFNGAKVKASCPDCGAYIKFMPTAKTWRIFLNAGAGMVEIEKIDTGRLTWQLKVAKMGDDVRNAIEQLLERRISDPEQYREPVKDIATKKIIEAIERRNFLNETIAKLKAENVATVRDLDPDTDALAVDLIEKKLNGKSLIINNYQKELRRVLKNIEKLENK